MIRTTDDSLPEWRGKILEFRGRDSFSLWIKYNWEQELLYAKNMLANRGPLPCRTDYSSNE